MVNKIAQAAWVLVTDGHRGILFHQVGDVDVRLKHIQDFVPRDLDDDGPAGARPPEQSIRDTDEATFAMQLANKLNHHAQRGDFDQIAIVADPQTLGQMRPFCTRRLSGKRLGKLPTP
jgi:protein required for attachment to host cells